MQIIGVRMSEEIAAKPIANPELVDKVAKNLALAYYFYSANGKQRYTDREKDGKGEQLLKEFKVMLDQCWAGTEEVDEEERVKFRELAMAALTAADFNVEVPDQVLKALLV